MYHPGRGRGDEKNFIRDFKLNLLKLVVTWLTSCRMSFSESDVPQTATSSSYMKQSSSHDSSGMCLGAILLSDCPTPISESLKGLRIAIRFR